MAPVSLFPVRTLFKMGFILCVFEIMLPLVSCELVPAMFDPETKQVIYNPQRQSQVGKVNKDLVVTMAQDVKMESYSRTSKSESIGVNFGFGDGIASFGLNSNKVKVHETKEESHHQVNIGIQIPGECNEGCREQANQAFQLANNALHGGSKQKRIN